MKMLVAVVQDWAEEAIVETLTQEEYRVTKLTSSGGFLRQGSTTLFIGVEENDLTNCLNKLKQVCEESEASWKREKDEKTSNVTLFVLDEPPFMTM